MSVNQWSARGFHLVAMVIAESSSIRTEVTFAFPDSGMTRGARVVAHMVFPAYLASLVHLLMSVGGTEFGESIFTGSSVVKVSSRESVLMPTSSLVLREVPQKPLMTVSPALLETTVGM